MVRVIQKEKALSWVVFNCSAPVNFYDTFHLPLLTKLLFLREDGRMRRNEYRDGGKER